MFFASFKFFFSHFLKLMSQVIFMSALSDWLLFIISWITISPYCFRAFFAEDIFFLSSELGLNLKAIL